jgi:hypothetical protein
MVVSLSAGVHNCNKIQKDTFDAYRLSAYFIKDTSKRLTGWGDESWTIFCGPAAVAIGGCERKD